MVHAKQGRRVARGNPRRITGRPAFDPCMNRFVNVRFKECGKRKKRERKRRTVFVAHA